MAIPTKEEFEDLRKNLWKPDEVFIDNLLRADDISEEKIRNAIVKYNSDRECYIEQINKLPVIIFFQNQTGYKFYRETVFNLKINKKRNQEFEKLTESEVLERQIKYYKDDNIYRLSRLLKEDPLWLRRDVISAFETYYYSEKWLNILNAQKNAFDIFSQAYKSVKRIEELKCLEDFYDGRYMLGATFQRFLDKLEHFQQKETWDFPYTRKDEFYRERGLVYDLYIVHKKRFKASKAKAIGHLMTIEGVSVAFDTRSIERLIKGWKEASFAHLELKRHKSTDI